MSFVHPPRILYVAWQSPESRRFHPVGRLLAHGLGADASFEFAYISGARGAESEGFRPFQNFPDLTGVYRSSELFPFFANRVMDRGRSDFATHVGYYRLDPATADAMDLLSRSGGQRATDSFLIFPVPICEPEAGGYVTHFLVQGIRHLDPDSHDRVLRLELDEELKPDPEPNNPADRNAMRLRTRDGVLVGYLPRYLAKEAKGLLRDCGFLKITVDAINGPPAPFQQRLLCRMTSCWPNEFVPFGDPDFQPIAEFASRLIWSDYGVDAYSAHVAMGRVGLST